MDNIVIKKCMKCGTLIRVYNESNSDIKCCNESMQVLIPNSVDAAVEKHMPNYEIVEDEVYVTVNHVMEKDHYIEWIAMENNGIFCEMKLYPESKAECRFKYYSGSKLYVYCNKHGLWMLEMDK